MARIGDEQRALVAFVAMSTLAGGNAVAIRYSNRELEPFWGAGLRFALAAALLGVVMLVLRLPLPRGRALAGGVVYGVLAIGGAFALAYYALVEIQAGLGQTLLGLVPLATLFLAVVQRQERIHVAAVFGGVVALAGIGLMSRGSFGGEIPWPALLAILASAFCFAEAGILVRRFPRVHPVAINAVGMATGALLLVALAAAGRETFELPDRAATWVAIGYLVPVGSVLVFVLYVFVLRHWAASRAAYEFVLIPVVTVAISAWLDDEPITAGLIGGGLLVLAGVYIGALRHAPAGETA